MQNNAEGVQVSLLNANGTITNKFCFFHSFTAGRANDNDIVIFEDDISRYHFKGVLENGEWWFYNLKSTNGIFIQDRLLGEKEKLTLPFSVSLGHKGVFLFVESIEKTQQVATTNPQTHTSQRYLSEEQIKARLLEKKEADDSGDYTRMVRKIIYEDRTERTKSYKKAIWVLALLFILASALVGYQQFALSNANTLALDMFYDIKTLEVGLSQAEIRLEKNAGVLKLTLDSIANLKLEVEKQKLMAELEKIAAEKERLQQDRSRLTKMKVKYRQYVKQAKALRFKFPSATRYEEELITRIAREFGESELELPEGFVKEVQKYISYWKGSKRMPRAMRLLEKKGYTPVILSALKKQGLPLHFLYLPLQESNFNDKAIGPTTRYGIAKGAWQFLASTGEEFGLTPGPKADVREYDDEDERFNFNKASRAGAKYLKHIYSTEAQASGLLVIAGYNYGHNRVKGMIKKMPNNPKDRNFWQFIQKYKIPKETYDYVFYIFSAAVIGQDPKHFGFKFAPPLLLVAK